jgi:hypothetical protein
MIYNGQVKCEITVRFIYEKEDDKNYMERAYLKRLSNTPSKSASRQTVKHPHKPGSLLGDR